MKNGIFKTLTQAIEIINDKLHLSNKFNEVSSEILKDYRQINDEFVDKELLKQLEQTEQYFKDKKAKKREQN